MISPPPFVKNFSTGNCVPINRNTSRKNFFVYSVVSLTMGEKTGIVIPSRAHAISFSHCNVPVHSKPTRDPEKSVRNRFYYNYTLRCHSYSFHYYVRARRFSRLLERACVPEQTRDVPKSGLGQIKDNNDLLL